MNRRRKFYIIFIVPIVVFGIVLLSSNVRANSAVTPVDNEKQIVKQAVKDYFDIRYQLFNVLQENNLATLSKTFSTKNGMEKEIQKLEVELVHAEKFQLRYLQAKVYLDFKNIQLDSNKTTAFVSVVEGSDVIFEILAPTVSSIRNQLHEMTLQKNDEVWKISSDQYEDVLWEIINSTGISTDELLAITNSGNEVVTDSLNTLFNQSSSLDNEFPTYPYNRSGAVQYAHQWYNDRNPIFHDFPNSDCTNFISQAINIGGGAIMQYYPTPPAPTPSAGNYGWFYRSASDYACAWTGVFCFHNFVVDGSWETGPYGNDSTVDNVQRGDIIQYDWSDPPEHPHGDGFWDHGVIIVAFATVQGEYMPEVASHSPNLDYYPYTYFYYTYPGSTARFIHIQFLRGSHVYAPFLKVAQQRGPETNGETPPPLGLLDSYPPPPTSTPILPTSTPTIHPYP